MEDSRKLTTVTRQDIEYALVKCEQVALEVEIQVKEVQQVAGRYSQENQVLRDRQDHCEGDLHILEIRMGALERSKAWVLGFSAAIAGGVALAGAAIALATQVVQSFRGHP